MTTAIAKNSIAPKIEHDDLDIAEDFVTYTCEFVGLPWCPMGAQYKKGLSTVSAKSLF